MNKINLDTIESELLKGNLQIAIDNKDIISDYISDILSISENEEELLDSEVKILGQIIHIGNLIYHNSDLNEEEQPIESGVYDILLELYRRYNPHFQVGAEPVVFKPIKHETNSSIDVTPMVTFIDEDKFNNMLYHDNLINNPPVTRLDIEEPMVSFAYETSKKYRDTSHSNPDLVGTLDKCKYVLNSQAIEKGVFDDPNVKVLERDFFGVQFQRGLINMNTVFRMVAELKYDGCSVVVSIVNGIVVKAESRGDTGMDKATDYTSILYGYRFPYLPDNVAIDVKCEAVMTYRNLQRYIEEKGKSYANCRAAINGLFGANDGYLYQKYITLVPLKVAPSTIVDGNTWETVDRITEIEFMNQYLRTGEILRYAYLEGDYTQVLFMIKKFVEEAEFVRDIMPTMYDGVVISYVDEDMIEILGRENFINKYSIAVKFNALKKQTTFRGYTFTVGQDGTITPMVHYDPVEFLGTIHTKSSISSYDRFMNLSLKIGDMVEVEYRHDVMPYVTKPDLDHNLDNPNPIEQFPINCPSCGSKLVLSDSGKTATCVNFYCKERTIARMANMMDKLGLKDFAEASMDKLQVSSLRELVNMPKEVLANILGDINAFKFKERIDSLFVSPVYDFFMVGALGFSGIAQATWKKIFNVITLDDLINADKTKLHDMMLGIKGIGKSTIKTIEVELPYFIDDIKMIRNMPNIISSKGLKQKKIRCSGFRDEELMNQLRSLGYDASDKNVTKDTYILLIPNAAYTSSKTKAVGSDTLIIPINEFRENMSKYI